MLTGTFTFLSSPKKTRLPFRPPIDTGKPKKGYTENSAYLLEVLLSTINAPSLASKKKKTEN
jgi:hypothetical protein